MRSPDQWIGADVARRRELWGAMGDNWWASVQSVLDEIVPRVVAGDRLLFAGNGGSAADAQHLAAEYIGDGVSALALTTDTSVLTAVANDFGYEDVFAAQLRAFARPSDVLVMHSTSGDSANLIKAEITARDSGITTVGLVAGKGGRLAQCVDHPILVPTADTQLAQEVHLALGHIMWQRVRAQRNGGGK